jgi:UDP-N-acetylmuramoyl-L-alanyl-D-glutamate--2,6-diaminopimelate ligase
MGRVASEYADVVIVTDDNPRTENPEAIRAEIDCSGAIEIGDRRMAIVEGVKLLEKGDILLIAGKGHETVQIVGDDKIEFDDIKVAREALGII